VFVSLPTGSGKSFLLASLWLHTRMALQEDLNALYTQQLFRAAESLHLEELDDFDLELSQTM